jgi:hypothetical protein
MSVIIKIPSSLIVINEVRDLYDATYLEFVVSHPSIDVFLDDNDLRSNSFVTIMSDGRFGLVLPDVETATLFKLTLL